ncbi:prolyl-tRNA synthetase associated domain-containing protein [Streptomyces bluensis]|uniref:prolyl-tRNA synthetase associated domain-containing protein n=1 Tax=Streptomyces bluensis TaxID=33897 RepID=UPI003317E861
MITRSDITSALDAAGITFCLVEHEEARTTAEADAFIEGYEGVRTKSLFLVNRKRTARYLLIMDDQKELDLNRLVTTLGENRLSFGSAERLATALGLEPGVVSPFGLIDPDHREVVLLFDAEMLEEETLTFHPGDNRATIFIGTKDLLAFLGGLGVEYRTIEV